MRHIMLQRALKGRAARILLTLPDDILSSYERLRTELLTRLLPPEFPSVKRTETLHSLADDIHITACRAYPDAADDMIQELAKDAFIDSLEADLRLRVLDAEPATLSAALR
eukprot:scpid109082/ scgid16481/ 